MKRLFMLFLIVLLLTILCISCQSSRENAFHRLQIDLLGVVESERYDEDGNLVWALINDGNATFTVFLCDYEVSYDSENVFDIEEAAVPYLNAFSVAEDWPEHKDTLVVNGAIYLYVKGISQEKSLWLTFAYLPVGEGRYAVISYYHEYMGMYAYPADGEATFMTRLLSSQTAEEAVAEWKAHFNTDSEKTPGTSIAPLWQNILSAIGGAVVAAMATWFVTYFVMRKKRGALAPAVAGAVPAGEVSAGSEGDVSAALAAPESPAPTGAAATDTPTPEETPPPDN